MRYTMAGIVELRGGKLVLNGALIHCDYLMPGDMAEIHNGRPHLISRRRQTLPGFVDSHSEESGYNVVRFPTFGESCPFRVAMSITDPVREGDIVLVDFDTSGGAQFVRRCEDEAMAILAAYRRTGRILSEEDAFHIWKLPEANGNYYTQQGIADETDLDTFTVDPAGSVDLDDAISINLAERTVYIHIVDIAGAASVHEGDEYRMRQYCQTLYLANELTEDLLGDVAAVSLLPGQERAVITIRVRFCEDGLVESYDIYRSRIISKRQLTYEAFGAQLETGGEKAAWLLSLLAARNRGVTYDVNLPSIRVHVGRDGDVEVRRENTMDPAHRVVAMLMVLCNMIVSRYLHARGVVIPNRLHKNLAGISMGRVPVSSGDPAVDSFVIVKRFARACYALDERGHFGLGIREYAHFTSPMRRYADVILHRLLAGWTISREALEGEVEWINWRTGFNRALQQQYLDWKVAGAVAARLADEDDSVEVWITGLSAAGVLWYMPEYSLNGFCHVSQLLPAQRWTLDGVGLEAALVGAGAEERFIQMRQQPYRAIISRVDRKMGSIAVRVVCS